MSDLTLTAVTEHRQDLWTKPQDVHLQFLAGAGLYLRDAIPSTIENGIIVELEAYLNELYRRARAENWVREVQATLFDALAQAAALSDIAKKAAGRARPLRFFALAKQLGETLEILEL